MWAKSSWWTSSVLQIGYPRPAELYAGLFLDSALNSNNVVDPNNANNAKLRRELRLTLGAQYITGERREILTDFPEFGSFRDIIYILKTLMAPTSDSLPEVKAWMPSDALLQWTAVYVKPSSSYAGPKKDDTDSKSKKASKKDANKNKEEKPDDEEHQQQQNIFSSALNAIQGVANQATYTIENFLHEKPPTAKFVVHAFQGSELKCEWPNDDNDKNSTVITSIYKKIKSIFFKHEPRVSPSLANPSYLLGTPISNEEDVLHVKNLPDFNGRISSRNCELLAQYLTAPYIRIP